MGKLLIEFQCTELLFCSVRSEMTVIKMLWCLRERQMRISLHTLSVLSRQRIHSWLWLTYCCMTNSAVQRKHHAAPWLTGALGLFLFVQRPSSDGTPFFIHGLFQSRKDLFNVIVCWLHCTARLLELSSRQGIRFAAEWKHQLLDVLKTYLILYLLRRVTS